MIPKIEKNLMIKTQKLKFQNRKNTINLGIIIARNSLYKNILKTILETPMIFIFRLLIPKQNNNYNFLLKINLIISGNIKIQ